MNVVVETVCCSASDVVIARESGATRIELCSAIELGGLTPSWGLHRTAAVQSELEIDMIAMLRPRPGGFSYSDLEFKSMVYDLEQLSHSAGYVFGILTDDRSIDAPRCKELLRHMKRRQKVFHRAFDLVPNPDEAIEQLIDLGFTRIMTSGGAPTALEGLDNIKRYMEIACDRIEIMPAGGIRSSNVARILSSGCKSFHLGPFKDVAKDAVWRGHKVSDGDEIRAVIKAVDAELDRWRR